MKILLPLLFCLNVAPLIRAGEEVPDLKKYEAELAADPKNELALYNAGVAAYLSGDFEKAVKYSGQ